MRKMPQVVAGLALTTALAACSADTGDRTAAGTAGRDPGSTPGAAIEAEDQPTGALGAADTTASCVESYSPEAVSRRAFAFDGTVLQVGPPVSDRGDAADLELTGVTFEVHEWFSGGQGATVTVDMDVPAAGSTTSEHGPPLAEGWRLLVSGEPRWGGEPLEAPIAWSCGFSRHHDAETAAAWRDALRR